MKVRDALLNGPLGFGAAPLGNMFRNIPDQEAATTVEAAWDQGTRYFDTAPSYGAGLSEIRLGKELSKRKRMNVDYIDFVWVHDIAQDFHGDGWLGMFEIARKGAFLALSQLRDQGVIKSWGIGVNKVQPVELLMRPCLPVAIRYWTMNWRYGV